MHWNSEIPFHTYLHCSKDHVLSWNWLEVRWLAVSLNHKLTSEKLLQKGTECLWQWYHKNTKYLMYSHSTVLCWKISNSITCSSGSCRILRLGKTIKLTSKIVQKHLDNTLHYMIAISKFKCFVFVLGTHMVALAILKYRNIIKNNSHNNNSNQLILSSFEETLITMHSNSEISFRTYLQTAVCTVPRTTSWIMELACLFVTWVSLSSMQVQVQET